jgi:hypothetical protein
VGKETQLQALPYDWPLVRQVQSGECSGDLMQTACYFLCWLRRKQFTTDPRSYFALEDDPQRRAVFEATLDLLAVDSGLLWRQCYLDRRFEVLRYLLTESATDESTRQLYRASIEGSVPFHPQATTTQGHLIGWSDPETTKRIHSALCSVEFSWLAVHFGTESFLATELYKKSGEQREVHALHSYFCELKEYYRASALANCGTLMLVD